MPRGEIPGETRVVAQGANQALERPARRAFAEQPLGYTPNSSPEDLGPRQPRSAGQLGEELPVRRVQVHLDGLSKTTPGHMEMY